MRSFTQFVRAHSILVVMLNAHGCGGTTLVCGTSSDNCSPPLPGTAAMDVNGGSGGVGCGTGGCHGSLLTLLSTVPAAGPDAGEGTHAPVAPVEVPADELDVTDSLQTVLSALHDKSQRIANIALQARRLPGDDYAMAYAAASSRRTTIAVLEASEASLAGPSNPSHELHGKAAAILVPSGETAQDQRMSRAEGATDAFTGTSAAAAAAEAVAGTSAGAGAAEAVARTSGATGSVGPTAPLVVCFKMSSIPA